MVEGGKVFGGASASGHDDYVHVFRTIEILDPAADLGGGAFALYLRGVDKDAGRVMPAAQDVQDVAQGGGLRRGHDSDAPGKRRNRLLPRSIEKTFRF